MKRIALAVAAVVALLTGSAACARATQVVASLSVGRVEAGEDLTLLVVVSDPGDAIAEPAVTLPPGLTVLGSQQSQSPVWMDGRARTRVEFRFAIGTDAPGRFQVGPVRVRVGRITYEAPALPLVVTPAPARPTVGQARALALPAAASAGADRAGAVLSIAASPQRPYVGQLVQLTRRLVQTRPLAPGGPSSIPSTAGFWAEVYGEPVVSSARVGGRPAAVTEMRIRLYPLAPGPATIGAATQQVIPESGADDDAQTHAVLLRSDSLRLDVRPLPPGAPAGFTNAVGQFTWSWALDREHSTADQPVTLTLDVRGIGNLPLLRTPPVESQDFEVLAGPVEDSLARAGEVAPGRRRFQWTLSPHGAGTLHVRPPALAWFDPAGGDYRVAEVPELALIVLPSGASNRRELERAGFPAALDREPARPGGRPALPWLLALGGALLGLGVRSWRGASRPDPRGAERAEVLALAAALGRARGAEFWRVAEEAAERLARGGASVPEQQRIATARYAGGTLPEDDVRASLVRRLGAAAPPPGSAGLRRAGALVLAVLAVLAWVFGAGDRGPEALAQRAAAADALAGAGRVDAAHAQWRALWGEAPGDPALAARLAWSDERRQRVAEASAWALRGMAGEPRSRALGWICDRLRTSGGLVGAPPPALPVRAVEWGALAFALALGGLLEWPRRRSSLPLLALAVVAAAVVPVRGALASREVLAVVRVPATVEGAATELDPGEVVRVTGGDARTAVVRAGDVSGRVPREALLGVREMLP